MSVARLLLALALAIVVGACGGSAAQATFAPPARADLAALRLAPGPGVDCERNAALAGELFRRGHYLDVHLLALVGSVVCAAPDVATQLRGAIALLELDEASRARELLRGLERDPRVAAEARVVFAWSFLRAGDERAFASELSRLPAGPRKRLRALSLAGDDDFGAATVELEPALRAAALQAHRRYLSAHRKRPWLAGTLSAIVPGAGQLYAGSPEGAAVALLLNGLAIGATVELAREELYLSSALTGLAASIFYVGNVLNAADLARRDGQRRARAVHDELERLLVPESRPEDVSNKLLHAPSAALLLARNP